MRKHSNDRSNLSQNWEENLNQVLTVSTVEDFWGFSICFFLFFSFLFFSLESFFFFLFSILFSFYLFSLSLSLSLFIVFSFFFFQGSSIILKLLEIFPLDQIITSSKQESGLLGKTRLMLGVGNGLLFFENGLSTLIKNGFLRSEFLLFLWCICVFSAESICSYWLVLVNHFLLRNKFVGL